jgi:hypothetical protein
MKPLDRDSVSADQQRTLRPERLGKGRHAGQRIRRATAFDFDGGYVTARLGNEVDLAITVAPVEQPDLPGPPSPAPEAASRAASHCFAIQPAPRSVGSSALAKRAGIPDASTTLCTSVVLPTWRGPTTT